MASLIKPNKKWGNLEFVKQLYKKEKNIKVKERLNIIRLLMKGKPQKEIAENLEISSTNIYLIRKLWDEGGYENLFPKHIGRVSKVPEKVKVEITEMIEIKETINGKPITAIAIHGFLKKNTK